MIEVQEDRWRYSREFQALYHFPHFPGLISISRCEPRRTTNESDLQVVRGQPALLRHWYLLIVHNSTW
jgi:hypothetical protein